MGREAVGAGRPRTRPTGKVVEDDIRLHVASYVERGLISKIAIPENVTFVPELPLTSVGKIDKKKLRADYL